MPSLRLVSLAIGPLTLAACVSTSPGLSASRPFDRSIPALPPLTESTGGATSVTLFPPSAATAPPGLTTPSVPRDPSLDPNRTMPVIPDTVDFGSRKRQRGYDGFLTATIADIEAFWDEEFPNVYGEPFKPLDGGVFAGYRRRTEPIPGCGDTTTVYADVEGNAFYCSLGDFIVYDDDSLIPSIVEDLGASAIGVVMAHEFGHAVQRRTDDGTQPVILKEQQADCFAGAWSAHIARGESDQFQFSDADVRTGLIAMIDVADPISLAGNGDPDAHGTGFDRVGAFQDGFNGGAERCKSFFVENRDLVNIPFRPDDSNRGDLPMDGDPNGVDIATLIPANLGLFWTEEATRIGGSPFIPPKLVFYASDGPAPQCAGVDPSAFDSGIVFCQETNEVLLDRDEAEQMRNEIGDMAVGYIISQAFSEAVQRHIGSSLTGEARVLASDCLTGAWAKEIVPTLDPPAASPTTSPTTPVGADVELSAGDLDEAIQTALIRSDESSGDNVRGSAFEKIAAFRDGVLNGVTSCEQRLTR